MTTTAKNASTLRVLILANGTANQTTGRLMSSLARGLRRHGTDARVVLRSFPRGVFRKVPHLIVSEFRTAQRIFTSDVLVVHSALSLSFGSMLVARLAGRPIIAMVWDFYPDSTHISGTMTSKIGLAIGHFIEQTAFRMASRILVPSRDYMHRLKPGQRDRAGVLPLWPCDPIAEVRSLRHGQDSVLRLAFAGQVNAIRGFQESIENVAAAWAGEKVVLHLFSGDVLAEQIGRDQTASGRFEIVEHGFVSPDILQRWLRELDFGLVCLAPTFPLPAFPSKILTYLCAGTPVLYTGPSMPALEEWLREFRMGITLEPDNLLTSGDVTAAHVRFAEDRDAYLAGMEDEWFEIDRLL